MKLYICRVLAITAFAVSCLLDSTQSLAQNAYITNSSSNSLSMIDTEKNKVSATIVGAFFSPYGVTVSPHSRDGSKVYVTNSTASAGKSNVSVIDTASSAVTATIPVGNVPTGVAVTPDGLKVYVANVNSDSVSVIDTAKNKVTATIPVGLNPNAFGMFIHPAREREPRFAGKPGTANCHGRSVAALAQQYGRLNAAATTLGYSDESELQNAIRTFCRE